MHPKYLKHYSFCKHTNCHLNIFFFKCITFLSNLQFKCVLYLTEKKVKTYMGESFDRIKRLLYNIGNNKELVSICSNHRIC